MLRCTESSEHREFHDFFPVTELNEWTDFRDQEEAVFEVVVIISRTKTAGLQQYAQSKNGYRFDPKSESSESGGTAAGVILQLVLRGAIAPEDVIEDDVDFKARYPGSESENAGAAIKLRKTKEEQPLFLAVSNQGSFVRSRLSPARVGSLVEQFNKLYDLPNPCVSPRSFR